MTKLRFIKIDIDSDTVKLVSERVNILSWATGGISYLGFDLHGLQKAVVVTCAWFLLQYFSFVLLKASKILRMEEKINGND